VGSTDKALGDVVSKGPEGLRGEKGEMGPTGPPGMPGEKGARGKRGKRVSIYVRVGDQLTLAGRCHSYGNNVTSAWNLKQKIKVVTWTNIQLELLFFVYNRQTGLKQMKVEGEFLISNFCCILNVVCLLWVIHQHL
jgi:hypothetical protein